MFFFCWKQLNFKVIPKKGSEYPVKIGDLYRIFQKLICKGHIEMDTNEAIQLAVFQARIKYGTFVIFFFFFNHFLIFFFFFFFQ